MPEGVMTEFRSRVDRFAGLSDRAVPLNLTRIESPDLLNVEFAGRAASRRLGYTRLHGQPMQDASARLDGFNDYIQIGYKSAYVPTGGNGLYVGIGCVLRGVPTSTVTLISAGHDTTPADRFFKIVYNPTAGTGSAGAWVCTLYDAGATATRTMTLDDAAIPTLDGAYRYLELYLSSTTAHTFRYWNSTPAIVQTTTSTFTAGGAYSANADDITVGVSMSAAATIGTDFISAAVCELRINADSIANILANNVADTGNAYAVYELPDSAWTNFDGYWRMNDGTAAGTIADFATAANHGYVPPNQPEWTHNAAAVLGQSGLRFHGQAAFVGLKDVGTSVTDIFASSTGANRWSIRGIYAPQLAPNETTARAQTILWAGTNATVPAPVAIYINTSAQFVAVYNDGGGVLTCTITATQGGLTIPNYLATNAKRCRFAFRRAGSGFGSVLFEVGYMVGTVWTIAQSTAQACTTANALTTSTTWAIGRHVTSFTLPFTYGTNAIDKPMWGVIDDFQIVYSNSTTAFIGLGLLSPGSDPLSGPYGPFFEVADWSGYNANLQVRLYCKFNEGAGATAATNSTSWTATLYPEANDGIRWDIGLVQCYRAPETQLIFDYKRFLANGQFRQSKLAISGCTLYDIDEVTGVARPVGANLMKGGKWTATQYGQRVFLASQNGQRPVKYDGGNVDWLGIAAPLAAPVVTVGNTASGAFTAGTYYVYYTFRNSRTGVESNPSPGVQITMAGGGGTDTITKTVLLTSADPQVDQRRIYIGAVNGVLGGNAFLATNGTIDDNVTTMWTTHIITPPVSGTAAVFTGRDEAPQASIVKVFEDFLFVAGNQVSPTRVWRSGVGTPDYFTLSSLYVDLDLDSGDPVTAMEPTNKRLLVSIRDGSAVIWMTGNSAAPVGKEILSRDHGAVGPAAYANVDNIIYYVAERDIWRTNGESEENISAPANQSYPSIQQTMRTIIEPTRRQHVVCANYSSKSQMWTAFTATGYTRNNRVLVYDYDQGIWSKYDLTLDYVAAVEASTSTAYDDARLYGAVEGFIVRLDTTGLDGTAGGVGTVTSTSSGATVAVTWTDGAPTTNTFRWLKVFVYRAATTDVVEGLIAANTATHLFLYSSLSVTTGDLVVVGAIPFYMDFVFDWGDPFVLKRLKWLRVVGESDGVVVLRQSFKANLMGRSPTYSGYTETHRSWDSTEKYLLTNVGGLGRSFRFRIGLHGSTSCSSEASFPTIKGTAINIYEFDVVAEVVDAP